MRPPHRLGGSEDDAEEVKRHVFFDPINWNDLYDKKVNLSIDSADTVCTLHSAM